MEPLLLPQNFAFYAFMHMSGMGLYTLEDVMKLEGTFSPRLQQHNTLFSHLAKCHVTGNSD